MKGEVCVGNNHSFSQTIIIFFIFSGGCYDKYLVKYANCYLEGNLSFLWHGDRTQSNRHEKSDIVLVYCVKGFFTQKLSPCIKGVF